MRVTAVADESTCTWLQLAGIGKVHPVTDPIEGKELLPELLKERGLACILVSPEISQISQEIMREALEQTFPIILEIPTKVGEFDPIRDMIRLAVGVEIDV